MPPGAGCGEPGGQREVIGRGTNAEWGAEKNPPNLRFQKHSPPAAEGTRWGHGALGSEPWGSLCLGFAPRQGLQGAPNPAVPPPVRDAAAWISHSGGPACGGLGDGDSSPGLPWTRMSPSPRAIPGPETDHSHTGQGQGLRSCLGHWAAPAILTCSLLCAPGQHRLHRKLRGGWGGPRQGTQPLRRGTEAWVVLPGSAEAAPAVGGVPAGQVPACHAHGQVLPVRLKGLCQPGPRTVLRSF